MRKQSKTRFARKLRREATYSERTLWVLLRDRRLGGFKFRRQHPIGPFTVDFVCLDQRLVIECDGLSHQHSQRYDQMRDRTLRKLGFEVLRFTDEFIANHIDMVKASVIHFLTPTLS
jgi:very-short-patch-repair endonuclease